MADAACVGLPFDWFFPDDHHRCDKAKKICGECSVVSECLLFALDNHIEYGVWGATSALDRKEMVDNQAS